MSAKKCKEKLGPSIYNELHKKQHLSVKYILFIAEYVSNGFNATQAYMNALGRRNQKRETAGVLGAGMFKNIKVMKAIEYIINLWVGEKKVKLERKIIDVLFARAFYDPEMFIGADGRPKYTDLKMIPEKWRCVIDGIETKYYGKDADVKVVSMKLADREKAAEKLAKYIELYKEAEKHTAAILLSKDTVDRLIGVFRNGNGNGNSNGKKAIDSVTTIIEGEN